MRILFLGTGEIGVPTLDWLLRESGQEIVGVVCQPDKPAGRKQCLTAPATNSKSDGGFPLRNSRDL